MDDKTQLDQPGDEEMDRTEAMNKPSRKKASGAASDAGAAGAEAGGEAKEEKKKGRDEWQTVQSPKAQRPAASTPPPSGPSGSAAAPASRPATPAPARPVAGSSAMPSTQGLQNPPVSSNVPAVGPGAATGVPMGAQLSRMGINNPTAQWASLGVGAFLVLCCGCSCVGLVVWAISGGLSSF